jgi:hypothetical protein
MLRSPFDPPLHHSVRQGCLGVHAFAGKQSQGAKGLRAMGSRHCHTPNGDRNNREYVAIPL